MRSRDEAEPFPHRNERRDVREYESSLDPEHAEDEPWDPPEADEFGDDRFSDREDDRSRDEDENYEDAGEDDPDYEDFHERDDNHEDRSEQADQERDISRGWERHTQAGRLVTDPDDDDESDEPGEQQDILAERSGDYRDLSAEESAVHVVDADQMGYEFERPFEED